MVDEDPVCASCADEAFMNFDKGVLRQEIVARLRAFRASARVAELQWRLLKPIWVVSGGNVDGRDAVVELHGRIYGAFRKK
jgi:hypothetical protein